MDRNPRESFAPFEAEVRPRTAAVCRLVQPVAEGNAVARKALAGADIDHVRVVRLHGNRPDREGVAVVEDRLERGAAVGGAEQAGRRRGDKQKVRLARYPGDVGDAAAEHGRADRPPLQSCEMR